MTCTFPLEWKRDNFVPIFKKEINKYNKIYRPALVLLNF